ncbi:ATP-dependent RNA helicase, putative [Trypanosoma cruzi]|uniref:ATP-dependent RNA helicase, putative n=1 Tax=Trypanosoma cruzi (strain CL Brener) TaxID=353153 RepID=Q4DJ49_TRYCC|nr:ATP-dependent RNA helicase, putative [Trypanosoma cruzi]EAN92550.1 ATP-dependent RNA helicase, putative [Trypanosoma cruzi]|eukprot:XP_814401.1 ATP-dependent RNA helicase [Trypanosoma cruzi strain CL Brener]
MPAATRYLPHSERTKTHYERFLRDLRRWLPPGLDDEIGEIAEETLSIVCRAGNGTAAGGSAQLQQVRKQLEVLFDTSISPEALHEVLQYGRLIDDFIVVAEEEEEVGNTCGVAHRGGDNAAGLGDGLGDLFFMQQQEEEAGDSSDDDESRTARDNRRDLMRFAVDVEGLTANDDDEDDGGAEEGNNNHNNNINGGGRAQRVTFEEVACNPKYVRDSLRRLFPTQTVEECDLQADRLLRYAGQRQVDQLTLETQLTAFLGGYDDEAVMEWIGVVAASRWAIVYGMQFAEGHNQQEKEAVMDAMKTHAKQDRLVERLYQSVTGKEIGPKNDINNDDGNSGDVKPLRRVDLEAYAFKDESTPHRLRRAVVPQGTQRAVFETHDEVVLPATASATSEYARTPVSAFPEWAQVAFSGVTHLNPMQSKTFDCAFGSDENMLVCAPTGAGKTNIAMMAMLRAVKNATARSGAINLRELKMVYVAPMKALVQEVVRTFSNRLEQLGLTVVELSGDSNANQAQLSDAQLIVTTPEKWDVVTRKSVELGVASLLKLLILDEVHLLHNERGPVLEAIVARTMLQQQLRGETDIRIVGLSATLPNYADVASFLQVDRQRGLFVFDSSFRPIPLQQTFCAIKKVRGTNQVAVMNLVTYDKLLQAAMSGEQSMVFVHSRKDTEYTVMYMIRRILEEKRTHYFVRPGSESEQLLREAAIDPSRPLRPSLQQMLPMGFAVHHAGMSRGEREVVERLFADRHVRALVCTSTLAWGVNLPANQVIIKGTRVFNAAKGETELLSALDVLQMFGRAGRVGFGSSLGRAAVITSAEDLHYYLSVLNDQLPIESQMMRRLIDMFNAEVVLGHVGSVAEGVRWLQRTYLYVRMQRSPELYGTRASNADPLFLRHLENIVHTAADDLRRCQMVEYDTHARRISPKPYGRIASFYYITSASMTTYLTHLGRTMHDVDLFRLFAMSKEFSHILVRPEEQTQLQYLLENAPIAVRESRYTPLAKINILLQCYISGMSLQGLPLMSELVYVKDSAQRIFRALHEICLVREFGRTAQQVLNLCLMVAHQQWTVQSPVRQLRHTVAPKNFNAFIHTLESRRVSWEEVRLWSLEDLAEKLSDERRAELAYECIHQVPHFTLEASVRPLTRNMLYVDVDITPDFTYNEEVHSQTAGELLLTIEHTNGRILHHEQLHMTGEALRGGETLSAPTIVVPIIEPKPTHYFVRCQSLYWLGAECSVAVCLMNVRLPDIAPPLLEMQQRPSALEDETARDVFATLQPYGLEASADKLFPFTEFFPAQRDLVTPIMAYPSENIFAALPPGGGKTAIAELFILQFLLEGALLETNMGASEETSMAEKLCPLLSEKFCTSTAHEACAMRRFQDWRIKFGEGLKQRVAKLEPFGEGTTLKAEKVYQATIIIASGSGLAPLLRQGAVDCLLSVTHIIADCVHLIRAPEGRWMEECLARLLSKPYLVNNGQKPARLLALSYPLISCTEVSRWMKIPAARQYNYGNSYRQLHVRLEALEQGGARSRYEAATVSALKELQKVRYASTPNVVFVPSAREAEELAKRIVLRCRDFVPEAVCEDVEDQNIALLLSAGVAYMHRGTSLLDELIIIGHIEKPARHPETEAVLPLVLVCTFESAWRLPAALFGTAFVCAAERLGVASKFVNASGGDCSVSELLQMTSRALNEAVVYCRAARRWVWGRLLNDPLPLESYLRYPNDFCDAVNAAVAQGRASDMPGVLRILQSHYFLYHLRTNLQFYGVPSKDDIPAYASEFARSVIASLQQAGCVVVTEGDGDETVTVRPTTRGIALSNHGITVGTIEAIEEAKSGIRVSTVAGVWRLIVSSCVELTPEYVGDAARITDDAEMQALQTIARAFPKGYDVQYVDLDFSRGWTKVQMLILAHCARMFVHETYMAGHEGDERRMAVTHPFASPSTAAIDPQLLLNIPSTVAERLREDLYVLLPSVLNVVRGACVIFDGRTQWKQARYLMRLSSLIERRTWGFEDPLLQLPCVQDSRTLLEVLTTTTTTAKASWSLERLQELCAQHETPAAEGAWNELSHMLLTSLQRHGNVSRAVEEAEFLLSRLRVEAAAIPRVISLSATGTVEEVDGAHAFLVRVEGHIACTLPPSSSSSEHCGDSLGPWWMPCVVRHEGRPNLPERLMALRVVTPENSPGSTGNEEDPVDCMNSGAALKAFNAKPSSFWRISGTLSFPLHDVDGEDLETLKMTVAVIAARYIADAEVDVVFTAE